MTPEDPPVPEDDALAVAARGALGRLADAGGAPAPWYAVHARGRRTQRMRYAAAIAASVLVVVAAAGTVAALRNDGGHLDVAGVDPGGTTTTSESTTSTTSTTSTAPITVPSITAPNRGGTVPIVIPEFPQAQASDFEGTLEVPSTTLVATQPMPVTLTLRNISDRVVWVPGGRPIGVYLDLYSATNMTGSAAIFAPGETRTYTSTITATPGLIGPAVLRAAVLQPIERYGTGDSPSLAGVPTVEVTVIPPGWQPGEPLDPSQGYWDVQLTTDSDTIAGGSSFVVHATVTNSGDEPQQTVAYGALAVGCWVVQDGSHTGTALPSAMVAPREQATLSVTIETAGLAPDGDLNCAIGLQFPTYDGSAVGDPTGGTTVNNWGIAVSNILSVKLVSPDATSTTTGP